MRRWILLGIIAVAPLFLGAGCIQVSTTSTAKSGGVFISDNSGDNWRQSVAVLSSVNPPPSIAGVGVTSFTQDPQDSRALYITTQTGGVYFSYDSGTSWSRARFELATSTGSPPKALDVAVDPRNSCVVYVAAGRFVYRSDNCNRSYNEIYRDGNALGQVVRILIDPRNSDVVTVALRDGRIVQSVDGGNAWARIGSIGKVEVNELLMSPHNSDTLYAATDVRGVWRSIDGGQNWELISQGFKQIRGSGILYGLAVDPLNDGTLYAVTKGGIIRTTDDGASWESLPLVTGNTTPRIFSFAIDPNNNDRLFYATATTFYRSENGGKDWATKGLPTRWAGYALMVDFSRAGRVYLGAAEIPKQ